MFCNFLEHVIEPPSPKKTAFFAQKWPKNDIFWPPTAFLGPEWSVVGPHTLFSGCWTQTKAFSNVLEQIIKGLRAAITKKAHFLAKNGEKKANLA